MAYTIYYAGSYHGYSSFIPLYESKAEIAMKPVKKTQQDGSPDAMHISASNEVEEEEVVPSVAALIGILLTGLLYLVLPPNLIVGPNWLLLIVEAIFVVPLVIDILTTWNLSH